MGLVGPDQEGEQGPLVRREAAAARAGQDRPGETRQGELGGRAPVERRTTVGEGVGLGPGVGEVAGGGVRSGPLDRGVAQRASGQERTPRPPSPSRRRRLIRTVRAPGDVIPD